MKGTPSFKMLPTVGSAESCIVRLPCTSTSCASARRSGAAARRRPDNKNILHVGVLILILTPFPNYAHPANSAGANCRHSISLGGRLNFECKALLLRSEERRVGKECR